MKKLLIIVFVAITAVAAAATLKKVNKVEPTPTTTIQQEVTAPRNAQVATWD